MCQTNVFAQGPSSDETSPRKVVVALVQFDTEPVAPAAKLLAHWPLAQDARDVVGTLHGKPKNIEFGRGPDGSEKLAALFNG